MDDLRFEWLRKQIYLALEIKNNDVFEEFISRNSNEYDLSVFLSHPISASSTGSAPRGQPNVGNTKDAKHCSTVFFYKSSITEEVEEEIEVPIGE